MEIVVNEPCGSGIDPRHLFEIGERRARNRLGGAETLQQRAISRRPDTPDLVERALGEFTCASCTMRADGEPMRLVAQALGEIERRIARWHVKGLTPLAEEGLAAGVAIGSLGD